MLGTKRNEGCDQFRFVAANFWNKNFCKDFLWNSAFPVDTKHFPYILLISRYHNEINFFTTTVMDKQRPNTSTVSIKYQFCFKISKPSFVSSNNSERNDDEVTRQSSCELFSGLPSVNVENN